MKLIACLAFLCGLAAGQSSDAVLTGIINDPSGAPVPGAAVTATNASTSIENRAQSNQAGVYLFPALPPGTYRVAAAHGGFQRFVYDAVVLEVGARISLPFELKIGSTTETVEVTGVVDTELGYATSSVGNVITGRKVQELPLVGRNVYDLLITQAGVGGANNQNFNGARSGALHITMDGANIQDNFLNALAFTSIASTINVDRIAEFRVVTSPADAELGRGSGQIILVSRSGTNQFHGSAFAEQRNTVLTANTWFNNQRGSDRNFLLRNQFGGRIGGPIRKNRTFFHFHYDGQRQRQRDSITSVVYTDTARQGIFRFFPGVRNGNANAAVPTVDLNGTPLKPAAALGDLAAVTVFGKDPVRSAADPTGNIQRTLGLMASPNNFRFGDGLNTAGFTWQRSVLVDYNAFDFRIDHNFSTAHRLNFSYSRQAYDSANVTGPQPYPGIAAGRGPNDTNLYTLNFYSVLRPNLLNEFRASVNRPTQTIIAPWQTDDSFLGRNSDKLPYLVGFTLIQSPFTVNLFGAEPQRRISPVYMFGDSVSWLRGKHAFKGGFDMRFISYAGYDTYAVMPRALLGAGNVAIQGISTIPNIGLNLAAGQQLLAELAGSLSASYQTLNSPGGKNPTFLAGQTRYRHYKQPEFSWFFKDDFKVTTNLTLNLGVRYEYYFVPKEVDGLGIGVVGGGNRIFGISGEGFNGLFQPGVRGALTDLEAIGPGTAKPGTQVYRADRNNFAPAVGLNWSIPYFGKNKTVLRIGFGIGYERTPLFLADSVIFGPGYSATPIYSQGTLFTLGNLKLPNQPTSQPLQTVPLTDRATPAYAFDPNTRTPYYQNWNVSLQRSLPKNILVDVRYVGNKGVKLMRAVNINEANIFENGILDAFKVTAAGGNAPLFDRMFAGISGVGSTISGSDFLRAFAVTQAFFAGNNPGGLANYLNTSTLAGTPGQLLRRAGLPENFVVANPQYGSTYYISNFGNSNYHSLQVEVLKRFSRGWMFQGNYTWSKALGNEEGDEVGFRGTFRTLRNFSLDKRVLSFSRAHVLRMNGIWEIPFGKGKRYGGWQIGAISVISSGSPINLSAVNAFNTLATAGAGTTVGAATPNAAAALQSNMGGVVKTGNGVVYFSGLKQVADPSIANIATPAIRAQSTMLAITDANGQLLMVNPSPGQFGNLPQNFLRGPGLFRVDLNMLKRFRIGDRKEFLLRADAVNALNHPYFSDPVLDINSPQFGRITDTVAGSNRVVVIGVRFTF
ncbi:MAG: carboxypeptidase regulatory-like domain-containing protein [Candidatus Solibacter usitatus]|nr:carboxypeptidase regulatory-like domain-containing protein [Candidatus Solibacter usitatus]